MLTENEQIHTNTDYLICTRHLSIGVKSRWPIIYHGRRRKILFRNRRCRGERTGADKLSNSWCVMSRYGSVCQRWYKRPRRESAHLLPGSTEVKSEWSCTSNSRFGPQFRTGTTLFYPFFLALGLYSLLVAQATRYVCEPVKCHSQPHNSQFWYLFCIFRLSCPSLSKSSLSKSVFY